MKKLLEILAKINRGEELNETEKKYLVDFKEPEDKTVELQAKIDELIAEKEAEANKGKPEIDQLKAEIIKKDQKIGTLEKERDTAKTEKAELERDNSIRAIAAENKFRNFDFLKFNLNGAKIDLSNKDAVKAHMDQLKKDSPEFFIAEVNNGGGGSGGNNGAGSDNAKFEEAKKSGDIGAMLASAPEVK